MHSHTAGACPGRAALQVGAFFVWACRARRAVVGRFAGHCPVLCLGHAGMSQRPILDRQECLNCNASRVQFTGPTPGALFCWVRKVRVAHADHCSSWLPMGSGSVGEKAAELGSGDAVGLFGFDLLHDLLVKSHVESQFETVSGSVDGC